MILPTLMLAGAGYFTALWWLLLLGGDADD